MYENELMHHGIPGQKWGVKHGPPYPLDAKTSRDIRIERKQDRDKKYIKNTLENSETLRNQPKHTSIADLDRKANPSILDVKADALLVNNRKQRGKIGRVFNCQNCAAAFEMRARGYDVSARMREDASNVYHPEKWFDGGEFVVSDEYKDPFYAKPYPKDPKEQVQFVTDYIAHCEKAFSNFCGSLEKQGEGARGIVVVGWVQNMSKLTKRTGEFHAFNYIVKDKNVMFVDAEGEQDLVFSKSKLLEEASPGDFGIRDGDWLVKSRKPSVMMFMDPREWSYMRTDNLKPNNSITEAVINRRLVDKDDNK